jgi:predicted DNA-binding transcriptional regulator YafY
MKQFMENKKISYNLMSFTAFRALVLFSLLLDSPKSYDEICRYFLEHPFLNEQISIDTLRVYINSLRRIGCDVVRTKDKTERVSRYFIRSNPFELQITPEQIQSIAKIYKSITKNIDAEDLLMLEKFLRKIAGCINNNDLNEAIDNISLFRDTDINLVTALIEHCGDNDQIVITYNSPSAGAKDIELLTDNVRLENSKIYLYGTSSEHQKYGYFLVSRILGIKEIKSEKTIKPEAKELTVGYEVNCRSFTPDSHEKVLSQANGKFLVEITSQSNFMIKQRLLSFASDCRVLYPKEFREDFVSALKKMRAGYA